MSTINHKNNGKYMNLPIHHSLEGFQIKTNAPQNGAFLPLLSKLAGHVAQNWNTILPSLLLMYRKLRELESVHTEVIGVQCEEG